jgi:hypothetical protein
MVEPMAELTRGRSTIRKSLQNSTCVRAKLRVKRRIYEGVDGRFRPDTYGATCGLKVGITRSAALIADGDTPSAATA